MQLSVVIPAHNEAPNLPSLIHEIDAALRDVLTHEIVIVDDGSSDETLAVIEQLQRSLPQLRCISLGRSVGQSIALMTGVDFARGHLIATLDGDGQNDPQDLPRMATALLDAERPLSMVIGHRTRRKDSSWRLFCSKVANAIRSRILRDATPDSGCGIKMFQRDALLRLPRFNHMHRFFPALVRRDGGDVLSLPVNHRPRLHGSSHYGTLGRLTAGIVDLAGVAWLLRRSKIASVERVLVSGDDDGVLLGGVRADRAVAVHGQVSRPVAQ